MSSIISGGLELPIYDQVSLGLHPGVTKMAKYGRNPDIDTGSTPEDVWNGGGLYTGFPASAETLDVVSSSASDDIASTGTQKLTLHGLDADYAEITEEVTLEGTTPVTTSQAFLRCSRAKVSQCGSNGTNVGTITVDQSTSGAVMAVLPAGYGTTVIAAWTVPADKTALCVGFRVRMVRLNGSAGSAEVGLWTDPGGGNCWKADQVVSVSNGLGVTENPVFPATYAEKTDLVVRVADVSDNNTFVDASFDLLLIPNELL